MPVPFLDLRAQYRSLKEQMDRAVLDVMERCQFIMGPEVARIEEEIARFCGTRFGIGVASGTDALHLSLVAMGLGPGDEVITTPFTFIATVEAVSKTGARTVFVDIDEDTFNLDVDQVADAITDRTKVIIPVHLYGQPCDMTALMEIAQERGVTVLEDCAQALGARHRGRRVGSFGIAGCISFFPSKNLGAYGDGGMVVTSDEALADRLRMLRVHGCRRKYYHEIDGFNSRLDSIQAAVLLVKLPHLEEWTQARRRVADAYNEGFKGSSVHTPVVAEGNEHVFYAYTVKVPRRDEVIAALEKAGVGYAVYYPVPLHLQDCCKALGYGPGDLPVSERLSGEVLSLPVYPELTDAQIEEVVSTVRGALGE